MSERHEIKICLGSSCFARGNKNIVKMITQFLSENKLTDRVYFHGAHCFKQCDKGPNISINGKIIEKFDNENVIDILKKYFLK
jgi:NADH:ubiquinone oxidoreductase subunit E